MTKDEIHVGSVLFWNDTLYHIIKKTDDHVYITYNIDVGRIPVNARYTWSEVDNFVNASKLYACPKHQCQMKLLTCQKK